LHFQVDTFEPAGLARAPNLWAFLFNRWPSVAWRKMPEGQADQVHWTFAEWLAAAREEAPTAEEILRELATRDRMRASLLEQMQGISAVLMPVCSIPAFCHRERRWTIGQRSIGLFQAMMPAVLANVMGLPAVTIPLAKTASGLPIGIQLVGCPYDDEPLLEIAVMLEAARGPWTIPDQPATARE
jgi:Asp-tRNA(Asn)/Glu-tRNA(Gln) amidotransferase A subunit family amidase